jgi:hypothetical protein
LNNDVVPAQGTSDIAKDDVPVPATSSSGVTSNNDVVPAKGTSDKVGDDVPVPVTLDDVGDDVPVQGSSDDEGDVNMTLSLPKPHEGGPFSCGRPYKHRNCGDMKLARAKSILNRTKRAALAIPPPKSILSTKKVKRLPKESEKDYAHRNWAYDNRDRLFLYGNKPIEEYDAADDAFHSTTPMDWSGTFTHKLDRVGGVIEDGQYLEDYQPYLGIPVLLPISLDN